MQTYTTYFLLLLRWGIIGVRIGREGACLVWRANDKMKKRELRVEFHWEDPNDRFPNSTLNPRLRSVFIGHTNLSKIMFFISLATIEFSFWLSIKYIPLCGLWAKRLWKWTKLWGMFLNFFIILHYLFVLWIFSVNIFYSTVPYK